MTTKSPSLWERLVDRARLAWGCVKKRAPLVLAALVAALGLGWLFERRRTGRLMDELALARAKRDLAELRERRALLEGYAAATQAEIECLDDAIQEQRVRAISAYEGGAELRGQALERELARRGL